MVKINKQSNAYQNKLGPPASQYTPNRLKFTISTSRGGSRTSPRRGRQSLGGGRLPNILVIFSEKPYEIKEILVRGGGGAHPPLTRQSGWKVLIFRILLYPFQSVFRVFRDRSHLRTTMRTFHVVRNRLHGYQWSCSQLTTKTKLYIVNVVNGINF